MRRNERFKVGTRYVVTIQRVRGPQITYTGVCERESEHEIWLRGVMELPSVARVRLHRSLISDAQKVEAL